MTDDEHPEADGVDLLGICELSIRELRGRLEELVPQADAMSELRARALAIATRGDGQVVTWELLRADAVERGGEEDLARLNALIDRATTTTLGGTPNAR